MAIQKIHLIILIDPLKAVPEMKYKCYLEAILCWP